MPTVVATELVSAAAYHEMAVRWGISKATTGRVLKKLADMDYISLMSFPGRTEVSQGHLQYDRLDGEL